MSIAHDVDFLIVGQGLAGSMLAWHLIHDGQRVLVVDDDAPGAASRVAAGLVNPLAGMRFNRRPELTNWLASAQSWYHDVTSICGTPVLHRLPMLRLLRSEEQSRFHARRREDPLSAPLLGPLLQPDEIPEPVTATHGAFVQQRTGYVALPRLLQKIRHWLEAQGAFEVAKIKLEELEPTADAIRWRAVSARHAVLCHGAQLADDPWFGYLPLAPDKGELVTVKAAEGWRPGHIINGEYWLVPHEDGSLRFGATHDHSDRTTVKTATARATLEQGLRALLPSQAFTITEQLAGVRPGTRDRYPLIGRHPTFHRLSVCNGFGARGALSAPWYTERLSHHLVHGSPLPPEADIARFSQ
jgi:glycine oxidase